MSGSDFPEGTDWIKGPDGLWRPPTDTGEETIEEPPPAPGLWSRFRSLNPWVQVGAALLLALAYGLFSSWQESDTNTARPRSVDPASATTDSIAIYEAVAASKCAEAWANPSVRKVIRATGEEGVQLAAEHFMVGFSQSGDGPTDQRTLAKVQAACERSLREAAGL